MKRLIKTDEQISNVKRGINQILPTLYCFSPSSNHYCSKVISNLYLRKNMINRYLFHVLVDYIQYLVYVVFLFILFCLLIINQLTMTGRKQFPFGTIKLITMIIIHVPNIFDNFNPMIKAQEKIDIELLLSIRIHSLYTLCFSAHQYPCLCNTYII